VKEIALETLIGRAGAAVPLFAPTALPRVLPAALALGIASPLLAGSIYVPNGSFESPATPFVDTRVDFWQKSPKPFWFDEGTLGPWDQLTGVFLNVPPSDPRYIDNCDGSQALFLFASPDVALFQDYETVHGTNTAPSHAFDARFEVGKSYTLTVGVIGGGGNMNTGATLRLSLYYRDGASNRVTVASTIVTNSAALFSNMTHFVDFTVKTPAVRAGDPWAGRHIGIELASTVDFALAAGYWDIDHVRLTETREPVLSAPAFVNGQFQFTLRSEPGVRFEVGYGEDPAQPIANWSALTLLTNTTGTAVVTDPAPAASRRFYGVRQAP